MRRRAVIRIEDGEFFETLNSAALSLHMPESAAWKLSFAIDVGAEVGGYHFRDATQEEIEEHEVRLIWTEKMQEEWYKVTTDVKEKLEGRPRVKKNPLFYWRPRR